MVRQMGDSKEIASKFGERPRNPVPTVDLIIQMGDPGQILLIERKNEPHGWALPGGFVDYGESIAHAAIREAKEETNLSVTLTELFHVYSNPTRDKRLHTASTVFIATYEKDTLAAGDDAAKAEVFPRNNLPAPLAFDHELILRDYFTYCDSGKRPPPER